MWSTVRLSHSAWVRALLQVTDNLIAGRDKHLYRKTSGTDNSTRTCPECRAMYDDVTECDATKDSVNYILQPPSHISAMTPWSLTAAEHAARIFTADKKCGLTAVLLCVEMYKGLRRKAGKTPDNYTGCSGALLHSERWRGLRAAERATSIATQRKVTLQKTLCIIYLVVYRLYRPPFINKQLTVCTRVLLFISIIIAVNHSKSGR